MGTHFTALNESDVGSARLCAIPNARAVSFAAFMAAKAEPGSRVNANV